MKRRYFGRKLAGIGACMCTCALVLSGCSLFGEEEGRKSISIVRENIEDEYNIIHCEKRNIILTSTISCTYRQLMEETLSFPVADKTVAYVYVNEGDEVFAGDVLAKLDVESLENDNINMREEMEKNEFLMQQADEMIEFYEKKLESSGLSLTSKESYLTKLRKIREKKRSYADTNGFDEIKLSANERQIEQGTLKAGIDGNVSFIRDNLEGSTSVVGEKVMTIVNSAVCGFQATDKNAILFMKPGDKATVAASNSEETYEVTLTSIDEASFKLNFELDQPDYSIKVGTRGNITAVRDTAENVWSLPKSCVYEADDFYYVYVLNESGVREMRKVTVGLVGDEFTEIKDGITETDNIILRKS